MAPTKLTQYFDKIEILLILKHLKNRISASHLTVDGNFWLSSRISLKMLQIQRIIQEYSPFFFSFNVPDISMNRENGQSKSSKYCIGQRCFLVKN